MKKFALIVMWLFTFPVVLAASAQEVTLKMQFDSQANGKLYAHPLRLNNTIQFDPQHATQVIVATQSELVNGSPVTNTMLVKCRSISANEISLQFDLVNSGFNRRGTLVTQPQFILKNGQAGAMQAGPYNIKVLASWPKAA